MGGVLASYQVKGCENSYFNGEYFFTGSIPAYINGSESVMYTVGSEAKETLTLTFKGQYLESGASLNGSSAVSADDGTGSHPVKLDTAP